MFLCFCVGGGCRRQSHPSAKVYVLSVPPRYEPGLTTPSQSGDKNATLRMARTIKINTGIAELNAQLRDKLTTDYAGTVFVDFASKVLFANGSIDGSNYRTRTSSSLSAQGQELLLKTLHAEVFSKVTKINRPLPDPMMHLHLQSAAKGERPFLNV
jgi:hypothetical protein